MTLQLPSIGRSFAQRFLPERTEADWAKTNEDYANRGYLVCSMDGCGRFVSPQFIRQLADGVRLALCPDRRGNHRMQIGPTAYSALLSAYNRAQPVFANGSAPTLDEVRAEIHEGDPLITLADAFAAGWKPASPVTAPAPVETEHQASEHVEADEATEPTETALQSRMRKAREAKAAKAAAKEPAAVN